MSTCDGEARRLRSGAIFNNRHFADVAAAAATLCDGGATMFTTRMVASDTGLADSVVRPILLRLTDAGVLERLPKLGGGRSAQYFQVLEVRALSTASDLADPRLDSQIEPLPSDQARA